MEIFNFNLYAYYRKNMIDCDSVITIKEINKDDNNYEINITLALTKSTDLKIKICTNVIFNKIKMNEIYINKKLIYRSKDEINMRNILELIKSHLEEKGYKMILFKKYQSQQVF